MKKTIAALFALSSLALAASHDVNLSPVSDDSATWVMGASNPKKHTVPTLAEDTIVYNDGDWSRGYAQATFNAPLTLSDKADWLTIEATVVSSANNNTCHTLMVGTADTAIAIGQGRYNADNGGIQMGTTDITNGVFYQMQNSTMDGATYVAPLASESGVFAAGTPVTLSINIAWSETAEQFVATTSYNDTVLGDAIELGTAVSVDHFGLSLDGASTLITASDVKVTGLATPEPATATLSLLALAGLASRRRRH